MNKTCTDIRRLINYALENALIEADDEFVVRNQLMEAMKIGDWEENEPVKSEMTVDEILEELIEDAVKSGIISDTAASRDLFDTKLMGILTRMPHEVIAKFNSLYNEQSPVSATNWYYDYSKKVNYVRAGRIAKDVKWEYESEYGTLDISINCSKPEKDPRDIAAAGAKKASSYPKCQLCPENAGFAGHASHPARQNLRPIPMTVNNERWQLQYSPYGYYNEHCIVFNENHIPMKIDASVFDKLFDIIDFLPHYFVGSNADLPIVGGSILSHEHFQGGNYTFPMAKAAIETEIKLKNYPDVSAGIVKWPMSVIRLSSEDKSELSKACNDILVKWRAYSDEKAGIFAETNGTPHNTITPIARKNNGKYECDLVLRNNITSEDRPLGIYHPNPSLHHIKKENIGLIEVMGLAILPARLKSEIKKLSDLLVSEGAGAIRKDAELEKHADWAEEFSKYYTITAENVDKIIKKEIGKVFEQVLCDAGVYKRTPDGKKAFLRFIDSL